MNDQRPEVSGEAETYFIDTFNKVTEHLIKAAEGVAEFEAKNLNGAFKSSRAVREAIIRMRVAYKGTGVMLFNGEEDLEHFSTLFASIAAVMAELAEETGHTPTFRQLNETITDAAIAMIEDKKGAVP